MDKPQGRRSAKGHHNGMNNPIQASSRSAQRLIDYIPIPELLRVVAS
jgi:hypothetical protein